MTLIARILSILSFILVSLTVFRPRSGWARLAFFVPKLFAGSRITAIGALGLTGAILGWFITPDPLSITLGTLGVAIAVRHVYRIIQRARQVEASLWDVMDVQSPDERSTARLPSPWVVVWRDPPDVPWANDVRIGIHMETGDPILADVWRPPASVEPSGLGIIYLHGSGWHYADKDFGTRHFFRHLANQGHTIVDVAYTLAPRANLFDMVADVKRSIAWMKDHALDYAIDPDRVILMGGSSGGHLALLAGFTPNDPRFDPEDVLGDTSVCAIVSYYGSVDLTAQHERFMELPSLRGQRRLERFFMRYLEARFEFDIVPVDRLLPNVLGGTPAEVPEIYRIASPSEHVAKGCPPSLFLQGSHDFSGMASEALRLHQALCETGCRSIYLELHDTDHGFDLYKPKGSPAAQAATYITERFLRSLI
jgi:acetyl esterase/lipase